MSIVSNNISTHPPHKLPPKWHRFKQISTCRICQWAFRQRTNIATYNENPPSRGERVVAAGLGGTLFVASVSKFLYPPGHSVGANKTSEMILLKGWLPAGRWPWPKKCAPQRGCTPASVGHNPTCIKGLGPPQPMGRRNPECFNEFEASQHWGT